MSDLTLTWAEVHACLAAKYGKRAFDALDDLLCATIGSDVPDLAATAADDIVDRLRTIDTEYVTFVHERLMDEAADEIVRLRAELHQWKCSWRSDCSVVVVANSVDFLRAVLDAIDALHQPVIDSEWLVKRCEQCDMEWPCHTHLFIHPMTVDEAIDTLGTVHK